MSNCYWLNSCWKICDIINISGKLAHLLRISWPALGKERNKWSICWSLRMLGAWANCVVKCDLESRTLQHKQGNPWNSIQKLPITQHAFGREKYLGISQKLLGVKQTDFQQYVFKLWNSSLLTILLAESLHEFSKRLKVLVEEKLVLYTDITVV